MTESKYSVSLILRHATGFGEVLILYPNTMGKQRHGLRALWCHEQTKMGSSPIGVLNLQRVVFLRAIPE